MKKAEFEIGDTIYYLNSPRPIGEIVGVRETYWSDDKYSSVVYIVSTPQGRIKRVCGDEVHQPKEG